MTVIIPRYPWLGNDSIFTTRKSTTAIVLHHAAGNGKTAEEYDTMHRGFNPPWAAIGYHYYIRKDGCVYRGRPENVVGAHAVGANLSSIGICFEGNYETEQTMPDAQFAAGRVLLRDIMKRRGKLDILRHRDVGATACPGKYFPFERMTHDIMETEKKLDNTPDGYAKDAVNKAIETGLLRGNEKGDLMLHEPVTRQDVLVILDRCGIL